MATKSIVIAAVALCTLPSAVAQTQRFDVLATQATDFNEPTRTSVAVSRSREAGVKLTTQQTPSPLLLKLTPLSLWSPRNTPMPKQEINFVRVRPDYNDTYSSCYIPVDSWIYPALLRLYSMGYLSTAFISMRPWTRQSAFQMLQKSQDRILEDSNEPAKQILASVLAELSTDNSPMNKPGEYALGTQSVYTRMLGVQGNVLRDSYHLGQTIVNDYGRPYQAGFNNITGFSTLAEKGRFSLYVRAEYEHAPAGVGYENILASKLSTIDGITPYAPPNIPQATIPVGFIPASNYFRIVEATASFHLLNHEISGGKSDAWLGPGLGGSLAWSNNAENIYSFRVNRVEPLMIPLVSRILGPVRYDFFFGSLKGHLDPNSPYVHSEMFAFRPTADFEFGFQRTIIFGGEGHAPVTLHTFLRGFFDFTDTLGSVKYSRKDPGARFSDFNFSWRLPFLRKFATLYAESICHDDVTPISAPRRSAYRTGFYLSQVPRLRKLDLRIEGGTTNPPVKVSTEGRFIYWEQVQKQGYTNKGFIMGDWIGRQATAGQAWITWHLSANEAVQMEYLRKKTPVDFIPGGTTQDSIKLSLTKRIRRDLEVITWVQYEGWKAPIYLSGLNHNTIFAGQITWFPKLHSTSAP